jgi:PPOX class probable F420-dependent enzyme
MDTESARRFLRQHHRGVLITLRGDGLPQGSPVLAGVDGKGRAVVSTRETAYKVAHVRKSGWAALCMLPEGFFGEWVQLEGRADILGLPEAMDGLVDLYRQAAGEHEDWAEFRSAMEAQRRVLLRISLDRVGPTRQG